MTAGSAKLLVQTYKRTSESPGNGQAAWHALKDKYACCTKERRRANYEALVNSSMEQGQDPDDYLILLDHRRARLAENGGLISDERFEDRMLRGLTSDYDYIRNTSYRDPNFGLKDMQSTMRRMYIDDLSRKGTPKVAGRGGAMSANHNSSEKQKIRCFNCHKRGHRKSECTQPKQGSSAPAAAGGVKKQVVLKAPFNNTQ
ncbi:unnamed protein product [Laminaria digitata]